jgi:hypothetical protein
LLAVLAAPLSSNAQTAVADRKPAGAIHVLSATYGGNCGAPAGNATSDARMSCDGDRKCTYSVDVERLGDPALGCGKAFMREYECTPGGPAVRADVPAEAGFGKLVELSCQSTAESDPPSAAKGTGIYVLSATDGGNCSAPFGNATGDVANACNAKASCEYKVDVARLGDPTPGCGKSFFIKYECGGRGARRVVGAPAEAGFGRLVRLSCP